ncbi:tetratricopeptide repeat protein [Salegentibacter sp. LM13S]|uniref:tetratricopeptide repeat-containing sensor histidine kinase n=1 Tax=Salegentibacter lacus TaxID=2873599 RepID=UPI001CCD12D0|nr:tetratricopeptide repeat-containing sensor histidine kinase [Salegentibacter lacus]MBZ9629420.1 tetratricopeptide repeat protein [Salegentibacter lacus]
MNIRPLLHISSILYFLFLCSCTNEKKSSEPYDQARTDSSFTYFEKGKNSKEIREKICNFNKAFQSIADKNDTLYPLLLDYKIYYHKRLKEYDSALIFADSLERLATFKNETEWLALALYRKAVINRYLDDQEKVFLYAFEARKRYLQLGDSTKAARRSLEMAIAQSRMQDYTGSQESATEALRHLNKHKDLQYLSSAHNIIAIAYRNQGFYKDALKEYKNALRYASNLDDSLTYKNNIGLVYRDLKNYEEAVSIFDETYSKVSANDYSSRARYLNNLEFSKWLTDNDKEVSSGLLKALQWRKSSNDHTGIISSYENLAKYYEKTNKNLALEYSEKWLNAGKENNNLQAQIDALKQLLVITPGDKDYISDYIQLSDSLKKINLRVKNTFAKIKFDEERKQQQISSLEASAALQALENQKIRTRNYILIFIAILAITLAIFIVYYLREKHKKEKILETHKTETRISKKIHDELANDVYNVMSSLEAIAPAATMDRIEHIYNRTRNISRENNEINIGQGYLDQLVSSLSSNCPRDARLILSGEKTITWNDLNTEKKLVIYRVLQEIMINMNKHSKASLVAIIFSSGKNLLKIQYSDNGIGVKKESLTSGNGVQNMENRIFSINGKLKFEIEQDKGLKILIQIPL